MPVSNPGPRLYRSIPFRYIGAELRGGGGAKNVNVSLNVVPFVDMMTILVCFLLMVFSATGDLIAAQRGLQLPDAVNKDRLRKAPIIIVTRDAVTFEGEAMATTEALMEDESMEWKIIELYDRLQQEQRRDVPGRRAQTVQVQDAVDPAGGGELPEQAFELGRVRQVQLVVARVGGGELAARRDLHDAIAARFQRPGELVGKAGGKSFLVGEQHPGARDRRGRARRGADMIGLVR